MSYNQFCPISKAGEILGERWTILILREILMGPGASTCCSVGLATFLLPF